MNVYFVFEPKRENLMRHAWLRKIKMGDKKL